MHAARAQPHDRRAGGVARALLALALATLGACSGVQFRPATTPVELEPFTGEVRVLERLPQPSEYIPVGVATADGVFLTKEADMLAALKREAAAHGANAVVLQGKMQVTRTAAGGHDKKLAAWAIRTND